MSNAANNIAAAHPPPHSRGRAAFASAGTLGLFAAILFLTAGRWDWGLGWLYVAVVTINFALNLAYLRRVNPGVIEHRARLGKGTKTWDKVWAWAFAPVFLAVYVIAALDAGRFGWSDMSPWLWPVGLAVFLPGSMLFTWSMAVNPFFEKTVRIQTERGHRVIQTGPYRFLRHPGYAGFLGWILSAPLLLGSWWAFLPAVLSVAVLLVRTALEDRTLRAELPGYPDYAGRVRFRLVPHLW